MLTELTNDEKNIINDVKYITKNYVVSLLKSLINIAYECYNDESIKSENIKKEIDIIRKNIENMHIDKDLFKNFIVSIEMNGISYYTIRQENIFYNNEILLLIENILESQMKKIKPIHIKYYMYNIKEIDDIITFYNDINKMCNNIIYKNDKDILCIIRNIIELVEKIHIF